MFNWIIQPSKFSYNLNIPTNLVKHVETSKWGMTNNIGNVPKDIKDFFYKNWTTMRCQETWQGDDGGTKRMSRDLSSATKNARTLVSAKKRCWIIFLMWWEDTNGHWVTLGSYWGMLGNARKMPHITNIHFQIKDGKKCEIGHFLNFQFKFFFIH